MSLDDFATLDHKFRKVLININVDNQLLYWLLLHVISGFIKRNLQCRTSPEELQPVVHLALLQNLLNVFTVVEMYAADLGIGDDTGSF